MAHDYLLVRHAKPDTGREVVLLEEGLEALGEALHVGDLAVGDHAARQLHAGCTGDAAVLRLNGRHEGAVQIQANGSARVLFAEG